MLEDDSSDFKYVRARVSQQRGTSKTPWLLGFIIIRSVFRILQISSVSGCPNKGELAKPLISSSLSALFMFNQISREISDPLTTLIEPIGWSYSSCHSPIQYAGWWWNASPLSQAFRAHLCKLLVWISPLIGQSHRSFNTFWNPQ